jgi:hypothetical protein
MNSYKLLYEILKMLKQPIKLGVAKPIKLGPALPQLKQEQPKSIDTGPTPVFHNIEVQNNGDLTKPFYYKEDPWLTVCDGCGKQEYFRRADRIKTAIKWGQLKLFTSELSFLNRYWNPVEVPEPTVVYVGAAPGNHIYFLSRMFPLAKFYLYDKQPFDARLFDLPNVVIEQRYFEQEDIDSFKGRNDVFFISDIRNIKYTKDDNTEETERLNTQIVIDDMNLQMSWVKEIQPVKAMIKFLLPYVYAWTTEKYLTYMDGDIYKQPWAGQTSTECRMVPDLSMPPRNWSYEVYQSMMFYHNNVIREHIKFVNPLTTIVEPLSKDLGLLNDWDSTVFTMTVKDYLVKFNVETTPDAVLRLCKAIIEDIGKGTVSLTGLRSGAVSGDKLIAIQKAMKEMGEEQEE